MRLRFIFPEQPDFSFSEAFLILHLGIRGYTRHGDKANKNIWRKTVNKEWNACTAITTLIKLNDACYKCDCYLCQGIFNNSI